MIESPALDFWRKSETPEMESYTIDQDFRKIQVKNTASYLILPYIDLKLLDFFEMISITKILVFFKGSSLAPSYFLAEMWVPQEKSDKYLKFMSQNIF